MHANLDQLLSLRDGAPIAAEVSTHVQHCPQCSAEAERLARTRDQLRSLPAIDPPTDRWAAIEARIDRSHRRSFLPRAAAATIAALAVALGYVIVDGERAESPSIAAETQDVAANPNDDARVAELDEEKLRHYRVDR